MRGAARLAVRQIELAAGSFVGGLIAHQFRNAQDGGQGIVELVRDSRNHLSHGGQPLGLNHLLLEPLLIGNIARRSDDARDATRFILQGSRGGAKQVPGPILMLRAILNLAVSAAPGN